MLSKVLIAKRCIKLLDKRQNLIRLAISTIIGKKSNILSSFFELFQLSCPSPCTISPFFLALWTHFCGRLGECIWLFWTIRGWQTWWRGRPSSLLEMSSSLAFSISRVCLGAITWLSRRLCRAIRRARDATPSRGYFRRWIIPITITLSLCTLWRRVMSRVRAFFVGWSKKIIRTH